MRLILQALHSANIHQRTVVKSPDKDVFLLCIAMQHSIPGEIFKMTGMRNIFRCIPIRHIIASLCENVSQCLPGFHAFTGKRVLQNRKSFNFSISFFANSLRLVFKLFCQAVIPIVPFMAKGKGKLGSFCKSTLGSLRAFLGSLGFPLHLKGLLKYSVSMFACCMEILPPRTLTIADISFLKWGSIPTMHCLRTVTAYCSIYKR